MAAVTIRNLSDETHRALKQRAAQKGKSTEAEMRAILEEAVVPRRQMKLGDALVEFRQRWGGLDDVDFTRDQTPAGGVDAAPFPAAGVRVIDPWQE